MDGWRDGWTDRCRLSRNLLCGGDVIRWWMKHAHLLEGWWTLSSFSISVPFWSHLIDFNLVYSYLEWYISIFHISSFRSLVSTFFRPQAAPKCNNVHLQGLQSSIWDICWPSRHCYSTSTAESKKKKRRKSLWRLKLHHETSIKLLKWWKIQEWNSTSD